MDSLRKLTAMSSCDGMDKCKGLNVYTIHDIRGVSVNSLTLNFVSHNDSLRIIKLPKAYITYYMPVFCYMLSLYAYNLLYIVIYT